MWIDDLPGDAVDPARSEPLHRQLTGALRSSIASGRFAAGTQLPTEAELQQKFAVSRSVVRQAVLNLTMDGLVIRSGGRGSIVAPQGEHHRLVQRISGLSTQMPRMQTEVLSLSRGENALAEAALGVSEVTELRRLRSAGNDPIALIETWLPTRLASLLSAGELVDSSLHGILKSRFGVSIVSGRRQVRAIAASASIAATLRIAPGSPLLLLEGTSFDQSGEPIEFFSTWHRADRMVFDLDVVEHFPANWAKALLPAAPRECRVERIRQLVRELETLSREL